MRVMATMALIGALAASTGWPQDVSERKRLFDERAAAAVAHARENFAAEAERARQERAGEDVRREMLETRARTYVAERVAGLDAQGTATTVDLASAALRTDVEGAEAGLSVAPFALFGSVNERLVAFNVFVGALKNEQTRVGARYAFERGWVPDSLQAIGLPACPFEEARFTAAVQALWTHFDKVCEAVLAAAPLPAGTGAADRDAVEVAEAACGRSIPARSPPGALVLLLRSVVKGAEAESRRDATHAESFTRLRASLDALRAFKFPLATACHSKAAIAAAFRQSQWDRLRFRAGLLATLDSFPRKFGFNPDPAQPLPHGQVGTWSVRAEVSAEKKRWGLVGGLGYGRGRAELGSPLTGGWTPSLSFSFLAARLGGGPLVDAETGLLRLDDGKMPPTLVLGLSAKAEVAEDRPASQGTRFNSAEVVAFLDVKVTEKLTFRLGVPLRGRIAVRKSPERRDLQWTVPVHVVTVLKL